MSEQSRTEEIIKEKQQQQKIKQQQSLKYIAIAGGFVLLILIAYFALQNDNPLTTKIHPELLDNEKANTYKWETKDVAIVNMPNGDVQKRCNNLVKDLTNMLDEIKDLPKGASTRNYIIKYCPLNPSDTVIIRKPNGSSERTSFSTYADTLTLKARPFKYNIDSIKADTTGYQNYFLSKLEIIQIK